MCTRINIMFSFLHLLNIVNALRRRFVVSVAISSQLSADKLESVVVLRR